MQFKIFCTILYFVCVCDISKPLGTYNLPYRILFDNQKERSEKDMMTYIDSDQYLTVHCSNTRDRMTNVIPPLNNTLFVKGVYVSQCSISNTTYVKEFKDLNIDISNATSLVHIFNQGNSLPPGNYTEDLKIQHISIDGVTNQQFFKDAQSFFDPLKDLQSMYINEVEIPPLPETMKLVNLTLTTGATIKNWGNCRYLERFQLTSFNENDFPKWPENCTRLKHLDIEYAKRPELALMVAEKMIAAAPNLHTLEITYCKLHSLPIDFILSAKNLAHLVLSDNSLYDEVLTTFPFHKSIRTLDLGSNRIRGYGLGASILRLPMLLQLKLNNQKYFPEVAHCEPGSRLKNDFIKPLQNSSIEYLNLDYAHIPVTCFEDETLLNVKHITISYPHVTYLKILKLPKTHAGHLIMDMGYNFIKKIIFDKEDYETLRKENSSSQEWRNLTVIMNHIPCKCEHGWLVRALKDFPHILSMPDLKCEHEYGVNVLDEPRENMECNEIESDDCIYRKSWDDGAVTAACDLDAWINMDYMFPIKGLNVSGNNITTLHAKMPDNITWIDLRHNGISRAGATEAAALFAAKRRVWLDDNLLLCDCDNRAFLDAILLHKEQVQDFDLLTCVGTGELLSTISTDVLCKVALTISVGLIAVLIIIAGVIAFLLHRYGEQLSMFLYSRGCCICFLQRKDLDDKPYDAFISFAHEDRDYVTETLLPGLEDAPEKFRVCVHYRDWVFGDWIPAQIMRSVQLSKRTLILLSQNFISSPWSTMELRYALANAEEDPKAKVLILIKDDVLDMELEIALKAYLSYNTYLRCDDDWFWEKLRYAMPHRSYNKSLRTNNKKEGGQVENVYVEAPEIKKRDKNLNINKSETTEDINTEIP